MKPLFSTLFILLNLQFVRSADIACSTVGGRARFLSSPHNSCVCVSPSNEDLPGSFCPTDPNGQPGCTASCGLDCYEGNGGSCYIQCNSGFVHSNPSDTTSPCVPSCQTDCNTFFTGPEFNKASKFCNSNFVCDYDCPSGSVKGCNGRPGCYSICTPASAIPAKMRRQAPVNSRDKRMNGMNPIIHLPAVASENGNEEKLCPESGLVVCPVVSQFASHVDYECVDPMMDKNFCGGCPSTRTGVDCEGLEGASNVQCINGRCVIKQCTRGYGLGIATDGSTLCRRALKH